jgi:hypothetical protein
MQQTIHLNFRFRAWYGASDVSLRCICEEEGKYESDDDFFFERGIEKNNRTQRKKMICGVYAMEDFNMFSLFDLISLKSAFPNKTLLESQGRKSGEVEFHEFILTHL